MSKFLPNRNVVANNIKKFSIIPVKSNNTNFWKTPKGRAMAVLYGRFDTYKTWYEDASMKKVMEMNLGNFMQSVFGSLEFHEDLGVGHPSGLDIQANVPEKTKKLIELKLDFNTTNSSSLTECINKLKKATDGTDIQPLLVQIFREKPLTERHKYSNIIITGDQYLNEHVSPDIGGLDGLISYLETQSLQIDISHPPSS